MRGRRWWTRSRVSILVCQVAFDRRSDGARESVETVCQSFGMAAVRSGGGHWEHVGGKSHTPVPPRLLPTDGTDVRDGPVDQVPAR